MVRKQISPSYPEYSSHQCSSYRISTPCKVYRKIVGTPMETNCAPLVADRSDPDSVTAQSLIFSRWFASEHTCSL